MGGNWNNQWTALAGRHSDQGCAVRLRILTGWALPAALLAAAAAIAVPLPVSALPASGQSMQPLAQVNAALQAGEADKALALLKSLPSSGAGQAEAQQPGMPRALHARASGMRPADQCQQAVRLDGQNSNYHLWLGRALGEKADRASFLSGIFAGQACAGRV